MSSWAECSELAFTEKKFSIIVHDKLTKPFSVYLTRAVLCQRLLHLCVGLHRLYVQVVREWESPPADLAAMRASAMQAALVEREELKKLSTAARETSAALKAAAATKASTLAKAAPSPEPVAPAPAGSAAVDMMMSDADFAKFQDDLIDQMNEDLEGDGYLDSGGLETVESPRERCMSDAVGDRAAYLEGLGH